VRCVTAGAVASGRGESRNRPRTNFQAAAPPAWAPEGASPRSDPTHNNLDVLAIAAAGVDQPPERESDGESWREEPPLKKRAIPQPRVRCACFLLFFACLLLDVAALLLILSVATLRQVQRLFMVLFEDLHGLKICMVCMQISMSCKKICMVYVKICMRSHSLLSVGGCPVSRRPKSAP
jgi:hypothetical protein